MMKKYVKASEGNSELQKALAYINDYLYSEFGHEDEYGEDSDLTDLADIGLMFTTHDEIEDDYKELQVSVDLVHYELNYFVDAELVHRDRYSNLAEMNAMLLPNLDFDELYSECIGYGEDAGIL